MLFRPVSRSMSEAEICNPWVNCQGEPDCWHLYLAAGDMTLFPLLAPYPLPFASWEKKNRLRFYRFREIARKLERYGRIQRPPLHTGPDRT